MNEVMIQAHGIWFIRAGECTQCGACGCNKEPCPHWYERGGLSWCDRYNMRGEYCDRCETDHGSCIGFPDNPWIGVVRSGACGFTFRRVDGRSMDDLPFLFGEPYIRR